MNLQIRKMLPKESKEVKSIGVMAFGGFEGLIIPKPKEAMVAELDGKIVGAIIYKIIRVKNLKIGYVSFAFIDPVAQGQGVGKKLYQDTIKHLYRLDCDYVSALVKDDNVASWSLFQKFGINRISILGLLKEMGLYGTLKMIFATPFFVAVGMEYYLGARDKSANTDKRKTSWQILSYIIFNLIFFMIVAIRFESFVTALLAMSIILIGAVLAGFMGTLFSKQNWHFRLNNGGFAITLITALSGGILPLVGNWYPDIYQKDLDFKRSLAVVAICKWLFLIGIGSVGFLPFDLPQVVGFMNFIASNLLVFYCIPFYPFESFAGGRVWQWNKLAYLIMIIVSGAVVFW